MINPYDALGVGRTSDRSESERDEEIRKAYLRLIRRFPPDLAPERFKEISAAYEVIKTESARTRFFLFNRQPPGRSPLDAVVRTARGAPRTPLEWTAFKEYLKSCMK